MKKIFTLFAAVMVTLSMSATTVIRTRIRCAVRAAFVRGRFRIRKCLVARTDMFLLQLIDTVTAEIICFKCCPVTGIIAMVNHNIAQHFGTTRMQRCNQLL